MNAPQADRSGKTLMIVEDEALVAITLRDELEDAGYHVLNLTDRHTEALDVAKASKPDLALVNIRLAGRDDSLGRPALYETTRKFLLHFGLRGIRDLPPTESGEKKEGT